MLHSEARRTGETDERGLRSSGRAEPPRALAADLSIIEQHLRALGEDIARLESGLAALGAGIVPDEEPRSGRHLEAGELVIEHDARKVYVRDVEVPLSPTEYRGLHALVRNAGRVVTHRDLLRQATGSGLSEPSHLKVYVARLRAKLRDAGASDGLVENVRGIGYRLSTRPAPVAGTRGAAEGHQLSLGALPRVSGHEDAA